MFRTGQPLHRSWPSVLCARSDNRSITDQLIRKEGYASNGKEKCQFGIICVNALSTIKTTTAAVRAAESRLTKREHPGVATETVDALRAELEARGVLVKEGSWGYRLLVVDDPDGNQIFFNYPSETASGRE